jgi:protein TonB
MMQAFGHRDSFRLKSLCGVALVHALLGAALIFGLQADATRSSSDPLKLINVIAEKPPPPVLEQPPVELVRPAPQSAPSPPALKAEASPLLVPPAQVRLELKPLLVVAPVPGIDASPSTGAEEIAGPGAGAGGHGSGIGSGGSGLASAAAAGGSATRTRRIEGQFTSRDYPREPFRAGIEGTTVARLTVGSNGRVGECIIRASSGNEALDQATCGIILSRFRFEPARDVRGEAISDLIEWEQHWSLRREGPQVAQAQCRAQADKIAEQRAARAEFFSCMAALGWSRR